MEPKGNIRGLSQAARRYEGCLNRVALPGLDVTHRPSIRVATTTVASTAILFGSARARDPAQIIQGFRGATQ